MVSYVGWSVPRQEACDERRANKRRARSAALRPVPDVAGPEGNASLLALRASRYAVVENAQAAVQTTVVTFRRARGK